MASGNVIEVRMCYRGDERGVQTQHESFPELPMHPHEPCKNLQDNESAD